MALTDRAYLKDLLSRHGFTFSKAMGQNFLINPSVCPRMAEFGGASEGVGVIEIGPGVGVLTQQLAERADKVVCIELDERLPPILAETLADYDNVEHAKLSLVSLFLVVGFLSGQEVFSTVLIQLQYPLWPTV